MIIGIAGENGAGKSEVVSFLTERSFVGVSLSDVLRRRLADSGVVESRAGMIELGRQLRREFGSDVLAKETLRSMRPDRNYVVDSIRHPAEVSALRAAGKTFALLWIEAPTTLRLERILKRARSGDPETLDALVAIDQREAGGDGESSQQLAAVRPLADHVIVNDGTRDELLDRVKEALKQRLFFERPDWDEYFMNVAEVVASRSNCVKRKVAAVVTIDKRIVSTGYNGTPRGTRNCNEGGCPRCNSFGKGGADLGECLCSHGEENAITQAAYHGVSLRGATLYTTYCPCLLCTKMIINAGIKEVVYNLQYPLGDVSLELLREAGVVARQLSALDRVNP
jgi:dCMP deaminase